MPIRTVPLDRFVEVLKGHQVVDVQVEDRIPGMVVLVLETGQEIGFLALEMNELAFGEKVS